MAMCPRCGVEVENEYERCPLCGASLTGENGEESAAGGEYGPVEGAQGERLRLLFRDVFGFIALAAMVLVLAVDFAYGPSFSWSRYPLVSVPYLWLAIFMFGVLRRRVYLLVIGQTAAAAGLLLVLDLFTPGDSWYLPLALPLTLTAGTLGLATAAVIRLLRLSTLGGISALFVSTGLFTLCTELILDLYLNLPPQPSWSLITAAGVIPIIAFLINFEKRLRRRGADLERHFHA